MQITDWNLEDALAVSREEGLADGRTSALTETARKMKDMGLSAEQIAAATGLREAPKGTLETFEK